MATTERGGYDSAAKNSGRKNVARSGLQSPPSLPTTSAISAMLAVVQTRKNGSRQRERMIAATGRRESR